MDGFDTGHSPRRQTPLPPQRPLLRRPACHKHSRLDNECGLRSLSPSAAGVSCAMVLQDLVESEGILA